MNFSNSTSVVLEFQPMEEFSLKTKVCIGLMGPVLVLLNNFLNFGIAYYERFGNDPQKRNFYNMMISSFCMGLATSASFWMIVVSIQIIWGPFDSSNDFAFIVAVKLFQLFVPLCILEAIFYRALATYYPKAIIALNDDWFHHLFNYWNIMIALIVSFTTKWIENPGPLLEYHGYSNKYFLSLLFGQISSVTMRIVIIVLIDISLLLNFVKSR